MAQYKHLPIYKTTYELLEKVTRKTKNFPRDFKYSLGDKIRNECIELVVFIFKANSIKHQREENLKHILERVQVIELMLRLAKDLHLLNVTAFSEIVLLTDSLARQTQGWITHTENLRSD
jgi:CRISPR/Cas system-associated endonuclease Cas3-HD